MRYGLGIIFLSLLVFCGCSAGNNGEGTGPHPPGQGITLYLSANGHALARTVDEDNPASEQLLKDISIFFTTPSGDNFTYTFPDVGFSAGTDRATVSLPVTADQLGVSDIYVITNYGEASVMASLESFTQMDALLTPDVDKSDNLAPEKGFCMYGKLARFDFTTGQLPTVNVSRTCAKYRFTMQFPDEDVNSTDNSFLITGAASHTFVTDDHRNVVFPSDIYFNFAAPLPLAEDSQGNYTATTYVYEATSAPSVIFYTHIGDSSLPQEYSAQLPIPLRNYLYDIDVIIYGSETTTTAAPVSGKPTIISGTNYPTSLVSATVKVKVYDERGRFVETIFI